MRKLLGFDMDGVILDSGTLSGDGWFSNAFMKTLSEFGIEQTRENAQLIYISDLRENIDEVCQRFGIDDPKDLWERREVNYFSGKFAAISSGEVKLFPDVQVLDDLHEEYELGIVSNSPQLVVDRVVREFELHRWFKMWIGRGASLEDLEYIKPSPQMLEQLKEVLQTKEGYYVGDRPEDIEAAEAASLTPIRISRNGGRCDISSLSELKAVLDSS